MGQPGESLVRVAILGQHPNDPQRLLGGVQAAIAYVLPELAMLPDLELRVIACSEGLSETRRTTVAGVPVTFLPRKGLGRVTWHLREVRAMLREMEGYAPDLVHAHGAGLYAGAAIASGRPAVVTVHGIFGQEARLLRGWRARLRGELDGLYERWVLSRCQHLITISPYVERVFSGVFHGQTYLVENPVDPRFFDLERRPVQGRMLLPAVVIPRKGVMPAIKAVERLIDSQPDVHLRVAGSLHSRPDYAARCQEYVDHRGLAERVTFLGHLDQETLLEEYATCELLLLPAFQETAPISLEQGMAAGVPCVATRVGGVGDMIRDGESGYTLPASPAPDGDPEALASACERVLSDPEGAQRAGAQAKIEAEVRFRASRVAQATADVYRQVLGS